MKRLAYYLCGIVLLLVGIIPLSAQTQWKDTIVVSRDGSGDYRTLIGSYGRCSGFYGL